MVALLPNCSHRLSWPCLVGSVMEVLEQHSYATTHKEGGRGVKGGREMEATCKVNNQQPSHS